MKSRHQKRMEAAARLERYAERIERGELMWRFPAGSDHAAEAAARRVEAKRLRTLP